MTSDTFPKIRFSGRLRPSQEDVARIARSQLSSGKQRLHIVAPPGSGKTVLGLYLWAEQICRPALVLSPNSAIQAQWAARTDLFHLPAPRDQVVSTDPQQPALLNSLTYQSVTLPVRGSDDLDAAARELWQDKLVEAGQARDPTEALVWIDDLQRHHPAYYRERLSAYRKEVRDEAALAGQALDLLHPASRATLERLKDARVGVLILDECHHLMGHWGRVLAAAWELLDQPVVIGLTATPPDREGRRPEDIVRYDEFFGPVDYDVPVPAVVKDGFLAPYQDLAYFVRPTADELAFIAQADEQFHHLVDELCVVSSATERSRPTGEPLSDWLYAVLAERRLPTGKQRDWATFERRDPGLADAARRFLIGRHHALPAGVPPPSPPDPFEPPSKMDVLIPVLDRYVRHHLLRSPDPAHHALAARITSRLRTLGVQITETGSRPCASPVGRVMAYSRSKTEALVPILTAERKALGDAIRAVVVTDYEKTSSVTADVEHLLDAEAGGAIAAFRQLVSHPETDALDPILVTGSSVLVDDDLAPRFLEVAQRWLAEQNRDVTLSFGEEEGFRILNGSGRDWCPRVYVAMITELFQQGLTRCLVGTRGLLGEGWDANKVNVLVDLTTATTSMTVNQLRGRSIRLDPDQKAKLADNWDVVCIAPEFTKGLDDYHRFIAKHATIYGVTDDGAIEKGVGHVHAAFTTIRPEGLEGTTNVLNADMLARTGQRQAMRDLWQIGHPYRDQPIRAVETKGVSEAGGFPPFRRSKSPWTNESLALAIGEVVLLAMYDADLLARRRAVHVGARAGGYVRLFLEDATDEEQRAFTLALREALGPLGRPRYVIPRFVDDIRDTWLSRILPEIVGQYFRQRRRRRVMLHAVPTALAKNKQLAELYQRHWNRRVSPGMVVYAYRGKGKALIDEARRLGQVPQGRVREKEIFR